MSLIIKFKNNKKKLKLKIENNDLLVLKYVYSTITDLICEETWMEELEHINPNKIHSRWITSHVLYISDSNSMTM